MSVLGACLGVDEGGEMENAIGFSKSGFTQAIGMNVADVFELESSRKMVKYFRSLSYQRK